MKGKIQHFLAYHKALSLITFLIFIAPSAQAAPTIIDSVNKSQLVNINMNEISSIFAHDGTLWLTDNTNMVYQWQRGQAPTVFQEGTKKQVFSSAIYTKNNDVILTDTQNNQFLISYGSNWKLFSTSGDQEGEIRHPIASARSANGIIYIADTGNQRISAFNDEGLFLFTFGDDALLNTLNQNLGKILNISIDQSGRVYVLDDQNGGRISVYSALGDLDTVIAKDELYYLFNRSVQLTAMTVRPDGALILADKRSGKISEVDWENMQVLSSFGTVGRGRGQFQKVSSLSLDINGKLYVADQGNGKIEIFQMDWQPSPWLNVEADMLSVHPSSVLLSACDTSYIYASEKILCLNSETNTVSTRTYAGMTLQSFNAKFNNPKRAVFDTHEIYILDDDDIKVFDKNGLFKFNFGGSGRRDGEFSEAAALALTPSAIYVADTGNKRIQIFSRNGLFKKSLGKTQNTNNALQSPSSIAVNEYGYVYVGDNEAHKVFVYSPKGKLTTQLGFPEGDMHEFIDIHDLMVAEDAMLYVMTATTNNPISIWVFKQHEFIYRFSPTQNKPQAGFDQQWLASVIKPATSIKQLISDSQKALDSTVELPLDLTSQPVLQLFATKDTFFTRKNSWVFNPLPNHTEALAVVDLNNHARHTFIVSPPPKQVREITIGGDEKTVKIQWPTQGNHFSGYYTIYGRKDISSPFKIVEKVLNPPFILKRSPSFLTEYRVSVSTALGKESTLSAAYQDTFWLGYQAYTAGEYIRAITLLKEATLSNVQHAFAWLYLGKSQMALHQFGAANNTFLRLSQFDAWKQVSIHLQAEALMQKHAWLDVKLLVDEAETNGNIDAILYSFAANALMQINDTPSAIYYINQAIRLDPTSSKWHLALANANYNLGAKKDAQKELLTATQLAGKNVTSWVDLAQTYRQQQRFDDAITSYEKALSFEATQPQALVELAALHLSMDHLTEARTLATKMASIDALKGASYNILGQIALAEKNTPQALAMLAKAGQYEPNNAEIWISTANAYATLNRTSRETEFLIKASSLDPTNFSVHMRLAQLCNLNKENTCAKDHFTEAITINPQSVEALLGLADTLKTLGKLTQAYQHSLAAIKLSPQSIPAHLALADIQSARGMIPNSIATLKKALLIDPANMSIYLSLSKAYISYHMYTEATSTTEKAILLNSQNPEPLMLSGAIYLARQSFDKAILAFEKAVVLAPDNLIYSQQLNTAYLQKKRSIDSGGNTIRLKFSTLQFSPVFSAAYKQYAEVPVAKLTLSNEAGIDYTNVKVSLFVKEYMDFPTSVIVPKVPAGGKVEVSLLATFNNKILSIDEDTGVQSEVRAEYYLAGSPYAETRNESMTIYGKNAIVWDKLDMVGSFTTPKDHTLAVFIRQLINAYNPKGNAVNKNVSKAMTVFNGLSAYGIKYLVDPNTPYGKVGAKQLDTVQFPRETLRQRSGDCDDLSILLSAALANLGIETAILDVPSHLLFMFNTGAPESQKDSISLNEEALVIYQGQVWIPLEATLIASSFTEAWAEGARKYQLYAKQNKIKLMPLTTAWENYPPVTLMPANFKVTIPNEQKIGTRISYEWDILLMKALERQVRPYRIMLDLDPSNTQAQMQIAVVFARNGLFKKAAVELKDIRSKHPNNVAALNNLGNIHFMQQEYTQALTMYEKALEIEPNNADIKVNMAMLSYKMGNALQAKILFDDAVRIDEQVPTRYEQLAFLLHH